MFDSRATRSFIGFQMIAMAVVLQLTNASMTFAHEGPPFPILMDHPAGEYVVSVWADPDIGEAQFFVVIESPSGGPPRKAPQVSMWVEPVSGRLDRITYEAKQQTLRNQMQFEAKPHFDRRDMWTVGFRLMTGTGESQELTTEVESTPPGYGLWDLAIYLFPFAFLGGMWIIAMLRNGATRGQVVGLLAVKNEPRDRRFGRTWRWLKSTRGPIGCEVAKGMEISLLGLSSAV